MGISGVGGAVDGSVLGFKLPGELVMEPEII